MCNESSADALSLRSGSHGKGTDFSQVFPYHMEGAAAHNVALPVFFDRDAEISHLGIEVAHCPGQNVTVLSLICDDLVDGFDVSKLCFAYHACLLIEGFS